MVQWDVIFANRASSRTFRRTVGASCKTQAVIVAQAMFDAPHEWNPVAAAEVPAGYYDKIVRAAAQRDADIEEREDRLDRERESVDTYNEG